MTIILAATPTPTPSAGNTTQPSTNHRRLLHLLSQCTSISQLKQIHAQALRTLPPHHHDTLFLHSRILHFSSSRDLRYAFRFFSQIETPNSFIWNTLIRACSRSNDRKEEAILLYLRMLEEAIVMPDKHTFPFVLKACAYLLASFEGKQVHAHVLKLGFDSDVYVNNSLVHFYGSCGSLKDAREVFDKMPERSVVSWNVMIDALVQLNEYEDALATFREMQTYFEPDGYAIQSVIQACAGLGALSLGMWAHAYFLRKLNTNKENDVLVNNCLLEMYCKCGLLEAAEWVFERMEKRNVASYNLMILGSAAHGEVEAAFDYFTRMVDQEGIIPNPITFSGVLSACSHRGLVSEGRDYFTIMTTKYNIEPVLEHYGCLVDLLARAGLVAEALDVVSNMPMKPDAVIWRSLLDSCSKKGLEVELSEEMARKIMEHEDGGSYSGVYMLLSRVYAEAKKWDEVESVRKMMTDKGVAKEPGCSTIEIDGVALEFFAGNTSFSQTKQI